MTKTATRPEVETEAQTRARIGEAKRRALLDQHQRAANLNAPIRDPEIVAQLAEYAEASKMKRAEAASLRIIGPKTNRLTIKALEAAARQLDQKASDLRRTELEQDRLYGDAKEPIIRAKLRGEEIQAADVEIAEIARDEHGARIIQRRGPYKGLPALIYTRSTRAKKFAGIEHAYFSGHLQGVGGLPSPEALRAVGLQWGQAFVIVCGQAGRTGEGGGGYGPKAPQPRMVEAGEARAIMAGTLQRPGLTLTRLTQRQVDLLDDVCGREIVLRDVAATRGLVPALKRRLRLSLATAMGNMVLARERGEVGKAAWDLTVAEMTMSRVKGL